jgi:hypothetical protein
MALHNHESSPLHHGIERLVTINLLKSTVYVMHQQVEDSRIVRSAHAVFVLYLTENKQQLVPLIS